MRISHFLALVFICLSSLSTLMAQTPVAKTSSISRSNNPYEQMLANEGLRKQLGIDNKKYEKILAVFSAASADTRLSRSKLVELSKVPLAEREQVLVGLRDSVTKSNEKITANMKAILSKEEFTRLEEAKLQMQLLKEGVYKAIATSPVGKEIGVTDAQRARVKEIEAKEFKKLAEEIVRLRQLAIDRIIAESLEKDQCEMLRILLGEPLLPVLPTNVP